MCNISKRVTFLWLDVGDVIDRQPPTEPPVEAKNSLAITHPCYYRCLAPSFLTSPSCTPPPGFTLLYQAVRVLMGLKVGTFEHLKVGRSLCRAGSGETYRLFNLSSRPAPFVVAGGKEQAPTHPPPPLTAPG